jgi:hypothetical protein
MNENGQGTDNRLCLRMTICKGVIFCRRRGRAVPEQRALELPQRATRNVFFAAQFETAFIERKLMRRGWLDSVAC